MAVISEAYINKILKDYVKSDTGKMKIKQFKMDVFNGKKHGGSGMLTSDMVTDITKEIVAGFISAVVSEINSFRGDCVYYEIADEQDGEVSATISVEEEALRRESLHRMNRDNSISAGEGVDDILALFTHGYTISKRPYGVWVRSNEYAARTGTQLMRIGALMHREPNPFLSDFVSDMNDEFSGICTVTLNEKYTR